MTAPLLQVRNLVKRFPIRGGLLRREVARVHAVDGVSFELAAGETLGVVGESGCGKSTTGRCVLRLIEPTSGEVHFEGRSVSGANRAELRALTRRMQIIFQDPYASLNPRMTVGAIIGEGLVIHGLARGAKEIEQRAAALLETVGLNPDYMRRYPHEFSGGQRQRIAIARALMLEPALVVADEPVSALDVSVQAQVLNLLAELQQELGLAYLFISHDLGVVRHIAHELMVMYLGLVMEQGPKERIFGRPLHPYTRALLASTPSVDAGARPTRVVLQGELPSPLDPPAGCVFSTRCPHAVERCRVERPALRGLDGRQVSCHFAEQLAAGA